MNEPTHQSRSNKISLSRPEVAYDHSAKMPYTGRAQTPGSQIDPTDPSGIHGLLIQDSYALIDRKMRLFQDLRDRATELEDEVRPFLFNSILPVLLSQICKELC